MISKRTIQNLFVLLAVLATVLMSKSYYFGVAIGIVGGALLSAVISNIYETGHLPVTQNREVAA